MIVVRLPSLEMTNDVPVATSTSKMADFKTNHTFIYLDVNYMLVIHKLSVHRNKHSSLMRLDTAHMNSRGG